MTTLAAPSSPAETLLGDLTLESGLAQRRWTPDEFHRLSSSDILSVDGSLDLADGEIVDCDSQAPHLFNRDEYYKLAEQGILGPEERTELIYGRIIKRMSPMSRPHSLSIIKTADALQDAFGHQSAVEQQMPLHVERGLEPEPDVMVLRGLSTDYTDAPFSTDVLLLVEVSLSTLRYDRNTKATIYAENTIADYWLVNVNSRTLEVRRQPENGTYLSLTVYNEQDVVAPLAAPNAFVRVADLLPVVRG